ncbi:MAG: ribonuclease H family protein [Bacteroidetes bacterium]|nr:ribonuclease H family protein [Bacteroidota bacterium]
MSKNKYYVVWKGRVPGIYQSWPECHSQVEGEAGARYKGFPSLAEAEEAFQSGPPPFSSKSKGTQTATIRLTPESHKPIPESLSVDAACSGNPGLVEYQGVFTGTGKVVFRQGPFQGGTNNIGEFLAIVHGLALLKKLDSPIPVYSDSLTARKWVKDKAVKTKLQAGEKNRAIFDLMERALKWLNENEYPNAVLRWDTDHWGEIPADFGRK